MGDPKFHTHIYIFIDFSPSNIIRYDVDLDHSLDPTLNTTSLRTTAHPYLKPHIKALSQTD